ncbi:S9 family peptidase [Micrococcoides hystricis]|uniref:S9 family peptidase n=1 Tax=Micrococcoides hystricis TaxID=1572761 RepID=A0ABV6PB66_9MICC
MSLEASISDYWKDLDHYLALPRLNNLVLSPNGKQLVTTVALLNATGTEYTTQLFAIDPAGEQPARQLTHGAEGAANPVFTSTGDLIFTSARTGQDKGEKNSAAEKQSRLYRLSAGQDGLLAGEAEELYTRSGALVNLLAAKDAETLVAVAAVMPGAASDEEDNKYRALRKDAKVDAIYHASYPIRFWDHDLGPDGPRFGVLEPAADAEDKKKDGEEPDALKHAFAGHRPYASENLSLRLLGDQTEAARRAPVIEADDSQLSPDGTTIAYGIGVGGGKFDQRFAVELLDVASGEVRRILEPVDGEYGPGPFSDCGRYLAIHRVNDTSAENAIWGDVGIYDLHTDELRMLTDRPDHWFAVHGWSADAATLYAGADDGGRYRLFAIDAATGDYKVLADDPDASFIEVNVGPDAIYALRAAIDAVPTPVRIDPATGSVTQLQSLVGANPENLPGTVTEVTTTADDGVPVRAWLVLPEGASAEAPAPLLTFIHGGPVMSWNMWSWRWNPYLLAAHGYAVLLPDPALSTGYGPDFVARGWNSWGEKPYTDLMSIVDETIKRDDIDETKTAALGGSFGGYMANWIAGQTDRFKAIVTHASLWALDQFGPTTDAAFYWDREFSPEGLAKNSPHNNVENINTPMLVIHGDKDYRVPIGEGLRLWWELNTKSKLPAEGLETIHRFLYFPQENHWILSPQHSKIWYQVVTAFLSEHVLGEVQPLPPVLGGTVTS